MMTPRMMTLGSRWKVEILCRKRFDVDDGVIMYNRCRFRVYQKKYGCFSGDSREPPRVVDVVSGATSDVSVDASSGASMDAVKRICASDLRISSGKCNIKAATSRDGIYLVQLLERSSFYLSRWSTLVMMVWNCVAGLAVFPPQSLASTGMFQEADISNIISLLMSPSPGIIVGALANTTVYLVGIRVLLKGLMWEGVISSWFLGTLSFGAFGTGGYAIVCLYFIIGSFVTKLKLQQKQKEGIAEARSGRRGLGSVLGSGAAGIVCSILSLTLLDLHPSFDPLLRAAFVASFSSKLADTVSSEIGKAYGKTTYLMSTLQKVPRGTEGAISLEGSLAGVAASILISLVALLLGEIDYQGLGCVVVASVFANGLESWIGAVLQGRPGWGFLTNDAVNVLQISVASIASAALLSLLN